MPDNEHTTNGEQLARHLGASVVQTFASHTDAVAAGMRALADATDEARRAHSDIAELDAVLGRWLAVEEIADGVYAADVWADFWDHAHDDVGFLLALLRRVAAA
jgi:hypothetical protein